MYIYIYLNLNKSNFYFYNLVTIIRVINKRTNLGNMYFEKIYTIKHNKTKVNITWFIK